MTQPIKLNYTNPYTLECQLSGKTDDELFNILSSLNELNMNPLMLASESYPAVLSVLLNALNKLSENARLGILTQVNNNKWNSLMLAARYHPECLNAILEVIETLNDDTAKKVIFTQVTSNGGNALMISLRFHPQAIMQPLLKVLKTLTDDATIQSIFMQVTIVGWNALMIAAYNYPETVPALLEIIDTFPPAIKNQILMQKDIRNNIALMFAAQQKKLVLNSILSMEEAQRFRVLQDIHNNHPDSVYAKIFHTKTGLFFKPSIQSGNLGRAEKEYRHLKKNYGTNPQLSVDSKGRNKLMRAAHSDPKTIPTLLEEIKTLDDDTLQRMFTQVTDHGWNALMIAAWDNTKAMPALLEIIDTFPTAIINKILMQESQPHRRSTLMLVAERRQVVLNSILNMEEDQRFRVLQDIHNNNPNSVYAKIFHTRVFREPSIKRGVLRRAEEEYHRIKGKYDAQSSQQHATAPPEEEVLSTINSSSNPFSKTNPAFFQDKSREFLEIVPAREQAHTMAGFPLPHGRGSVISNP